MPLFKKPDFWFPNNRYYANDRQKSVVMFNNQLYVCNTTHISGNIFDTNYFTSISGSGGGLVATDWDIVGTTTTLPPEQTNVKLNGLIDTTFTDGVIEIITANNPLSLYPYGPAFSFGGYKLNIDRLNTEIKEIIIKDFDADNNDQIIFVLSNKNLYDIMGIITSGSGTGDSSLSIVISTFGSSGVIVSIKDSLDNDVYENSGGFSESGLVDVTIRINQEIIQVLVNDILIVNADLTGLDWQSNIIGNMNMYLVSTHLDGLLNRSEIKYQMITPFTVTESITIVEPPIDAIDGSLYQLTSASNYNGYALEENDYVIFQNSLQQLIIIPNTISEIPTLVLDSFKNKVYERGIIDEIYEQMPVQSIQFTKFFTFLVLSTGFIYSILDASNFTYINIDPLDNTFRIKNSGLLLVRNNTGANNPNNNINIIDEDFLVLKTAITNNSLPYQLIEENSYNKRIKPIVLLQSYQHEIYLGEEIGNKLFIFDNTVNSSTIILNSAYYNPVQSPSYSHIKETTIIINNTDSVFKFLEISGGYIPNNRIKINPYNKVLLKVTSNFNSNSGANSFIDVDFGNQKGINTTEYITGTNTSIYHYVKDIIINSASNIVINLLHNYDLGHTYNIYNAGPSNNITLNITGSYTVTYNFTLATGESRKLVMKNIYNVGSSNGVFK